ncbi:MAG: molybdenum cofactor guanylyltransferase [Candidatus Thorarchaeota archaeon]|nr:molybdenum cofactor guanylyltransferase [Candidatus Thorarchaeota archaeon]
MMTDVTVAILAGGNSKRFGSEKALANFHDRPLISHMLDIARKVSGNILIVLSDNAQLEKIKPYVKIGRTVVDPEGSTKSALSGAITAFEYAGTEHTLLLPIDAPLAKPHLLKVLVEMSPTHGAVVPSWPSGYIEPLHSVYLTEHAYYHGMKVTESGSYKMSSMLEHLQNVLYVSTETLKQFDAKLETFKNFNTLRDLKAAER